jgi:hypothetical protein
MHRITIALVLFAGSCVSPLFAACQTPGPTGNLTQQLQATYAPTLMDATGYKVTQPGCTLVVQKEGIQACPSTKTVMRSVYEDGQVAPESKNSVVNTGKKIGRLPGISLIPGVGAAASAGAQAVPDGAACPGGTARGYTVGEKVYLTKFEVRDQAKDNGLIFSLQSCGTCDPAAADPAHKPYRADLRISLNKGFLGSTDLKSIERVVSEVLAFPDEAKKDDTQQVSQGAQPASTAPAPEAAPLASAPPANFAPIPPPPPPPADAPAPPPVNIAPGQTPDQVKVALGEPDKITKFGKKEIYSYKTVKVTFVDGKVSDVE